MVAPARLRTHAGQLPRHGALAGSVLWVEAAAAAFDALRVLNDALGQPLGPVELGFFVVLAMVALAFEIGLT